MFKTKDFINLFRFPNSRNTTNKNALTPHFFLKKMTKDTRIELTEND